MSTTRRITDDDDDDESVAEYFKQIDQCDKLPDAILFQESTEVQKMNLKVGKQIRIFKENDTNGNIDPDIYVITTINKDLNTNLITNIDIISTVDNTITKNIGLKDIHNIVNINPESLYIDKDFLDRITTTDTNNLTPVTQLKYELHKATIAFIRQKKFGAENADALVAFQEETFNIAKAEGNIIHLKNEILNLPNNQRNSIYMLIEQLKNIALDPIKRTTDCYYIQYLNTALNNLGLYPEIKDSLLNNYIFLCECLSATVIAGAIQLGFTRRTWIFNILYIFLERIHNIPGINVYIITPTITLYLYTNMDTIYLSTNYLINRINELLSIILCSITTAIDTIQNNNNNNDNNNDNNTIASQGSNTIATNSSSETLITLSTFPSMESLETLYNSQYVIDINDNYNVKTYSKALTNDLKIITQNNSILESSQNSSLESQQSSHSSDGRIGGKIKRSRITKKHKRITIRRSKRSKKMKGGKRTRSTKKRHVGRRRKHNTKKY
jgi:hypothetical protein